MTSITIQQRALLQPLSQYAPVPESLARILSARNVTVHQLQLQLKHLLAPDLKGLNEAVQLLDHAIDRHQRIVIVGDYDVDGATSTALMLLVLRQMGAQVDYIVPDRFKYGYGLTPAIADLAYGRFRPDILVTVDNGISSHEGVARCHELGMQVVITDHHLTTKATPTAQAVVNPNQLGCPFSSKALAGVGVAFYVLARLASLRKQANKSTAQLTAFLDLVALGTVADVAKLDYNNRILVNAGLQNIRRHQCRVGILALLEIAGKNPTQLQAQDFGFVLGPRLNAAGRMDSMDIGIECLITADAQQAYQLAQQLDQLNQERRSVEAHMRRQADDTLASLSNHDQEHNQLPPALVLYDETWHQGVIGIVAGRLKEHYHRPSIVFAPDQDGIHIKGSARSIAGIHIRDCIEQVAQHHPQVVKYFGGHAAAAGLTIEKQHFEVFRQAFIANVATHHADLFQAKILTDGCLAADEISLDFLAQIERFEPWGQGFEDPIFEGVFEVRQSQWLKNVHLKLWLALENGAVVEAIGFNLRDKVTDNMTNTIRLVYQLEKNAFRGDVKLQLKIIHLENIE